MRARAHRHLPSVVLLAAAGLAGCGGSTTPQDPAKTSVARATLHRAQSCDDLAAQLRADALAKLNARIDQQIAWARQGSWGWATPAGGPRDGFNSAPEAAAGGGQGSGSAKDDSGGAASTHSDTNTQVPGVDEADIVKTDGKHVYVLHGQSLFVLDAWPAASLAVAAQIAIEGQPTEMFVEGDHAVVFSTVDGNPVFQAAGVTARSSYSDYGYGWGIGVGVADAPPPRTDTDTATPDAPPSGGAPDEPADAGVAEPGDAGAPADADGGSGSSNAGDPKPGIDPGAPYPGGIYAPLTKITVLSLGGGANPTVTAEHWFEGSYLSSRRVGSKVRTVLDGGAHGPALAYAPDFGSAAPTSVDAWVAAWEALRAESAAIIEQAPVTDWLPWQFRRDGANVVASSPACDQFYLPTAQTTQYGLVQIESLDWTAPAEVKGVDIVGRAETVYATASSLYVAAAAWNDAYVGAEVANALGAPIVVPGARTHLHAFDLTADQPEYVASGTVLGTLLDQFSLDEKDGLLRVATTEDRMFITPGGGVGGTDVGVAVPGSGGGGSTIGSGSSGSGSTGSVPPSPPALDGGAAEPEPAPPSGGGSRTAQDVAVPSTPLRASHVSVLARSGDSLDVIGTTGDLAPDERLYAARFVGDRAYVVTFHQVDPLFAIDLSVPTAPVVRGELTIPGFSQYMHPIDEQHLLTIGQDTEQVSGGGTRVTGVSLQLFDVTDATVPKLVSKFAYTDPSGSSSAAWDHKAFTWYPAQKTLAFPYTSWGQNGQTSTLELFSVDAANGIAKLGSIDHSPFFSGAPQGGWCGGYYGVEVRRGLFLDDYVYSVSYGGVVATQLSSLSTPVATLALPSPASDAPLCAGGPLAD